MCRELTFLMLTLAVSLVVVAPACGDDITWDFENGNDHGFTLWSVNPATGAADDPTTAGDEALTGVGGSKGLPDAGSAWSVGRPDQFDGQKPAISEGDKARADGTMEYNQSGKNHPFTFPVNNRDQESYLNTYNLTGWGDNLHSGTNDQIATSPLVLLGSNAELTVWVHGGGNGTHAPALDSNAGQGYTTNSAGVAVISAADGSLLASVLTNGHGTLREDTIDLSSLSGQMVHIEVVDAFQGSWGWIAVDEIRITNSIELGDAGPFPKAWGPDPADGAVHNATWVNLAWTAGAFAVSHDVYLGDNFDDVNDATVDSPAFRGNQTDAMLIAGFFGFPYPNGLTAGTTYYWRIDEVNDTEPNSPWKGDIWSFSVPPKQAYDPVPAEGAKFIAPDTELSWTGGMGAIYHTVYFGDNFDNVSNAADGLPQGSATFTPPGPLEAGRAYYWRVDEFDAFETHKGDVWSFEVAKQGGGLKGEYYHWGGDFTPGQPFQTFVLERVDPEINWNWGNGDTRGTNSPHESVNVDDFACRWTGEVEAAFTEPYTFYTTTDDGARLWVDGKEIVKGAWRQQGMTEYAGTIELEAGKKYFIEMWMYEHGGGAGAELRWSSPRTPKQIIPSAALSLPVRANSPFPCNGIVGVNLMSTLTWKPGDSAASHEFYFGTDADVVANATKASPEYKTSTQLGDESFDPGKLAYDTTYFWRIDEVNNVHPDSPWTGSVWSFSTGPFLVVDDFEAYNDIDPADPASNTIFGSWTDGYQIPTNGALTAGEFPPYAEQAIVHGGNQSMKYVYDTNLMICESILTLNYPKDWTEESVTKLSLWFRGASGNAAERMFVALNDTAVVYHDDPAAPQITEWNEWVIDLQAFADQGVDLTNVSTMTIGFGTKNSPAAGGTGEVYFDNIRLYR